MNSRRQFVITRKRKNQLKAKERKRLSRKVNEWDEETRWMADIRQARRNMSVQSPVMTSAALCWPDGVI